ncbi:MAG TPA: MBL fold metallo-hydrolase, partial [Gemmatimonadales bacterium]
MFQGLKSQRERNWATPPFDPRTLDAVVLSHAHLDHSGLLPRIVRQGYGRPIHCTAATADLLGVMLLDSAELMEEETERANRYGYSRHKPALPLFDRTDVEATLKLLRPHRYGVAFPVAEGARALFRPAGHILGSATVELRLGGRRPKRVVFSGDLGRWNRPILHDPAPVTKADVLLLESTYGDRAHEPDVASALAEALTDAARRGRAILIPAFALGRTQEILWWIRQLEEENRIPALPVYLDSPLALDVTGIYAKHPEEHDLDTREMMEEGRSPFRPKRLHLARSSADSRALNNIEGPVIIIAGSGMATGGRILHHLKLRLPEPRTMVLLPGYQAEGTRGQQLQEGTRQTKIHGTTVTVRAHIRTVHGLSAHADREDLLRWLADFQAHPAPHLPRHGEPGPARALAKTIRKRFGVEAKAAGD